MVDGAVGYNGVEEVPIGPPDPPAALWLLPSGGGGEGFGTGCGCGGVKDCGCDEG